ncbi:MAG: creatininase family protein, partial [Acidimicrobiales bacterium]
GGSGDAHAGFTETSALLAVQPSSVRLEAAAAGCTSPLGELMAVLVEAGVAAVSDNGVLGDPTGASPAEGRRILDGWADALAVDLDGWP